MPAPATGALTRMARPHRRRVAAAAAALACRSTTPSSPTIPSSSRCASRRQLRASRRAAAAWYALTCTRRVYHTHRTYAVAAHFACSGPHVLLPAHHPHRAARASGGRRRAGSEPLRQGAAAVQLRHDVLPLHQVPRQVKGVGSAMFGETRCGAAPEDGGAEVVAVARPGAAPHIQPRPFFRDHVEVLVQ